MKIFKETESKKTIHMVFMLFCNRFSIEELNHQ